MKKLILAMCLIFGCVEEPARLQEKMRNNPISYSLLPKTSQEPEPELPNKPIYTSAGTFTANEYFDEYQSNEVAFEIKLKEKFFNLEGIVHRVSKSRNSNYAIVELKVSQINRVRAFVETNKVGAIKANSKVNFLCLWMEKDFIYPAADCVPVKVN